MLFYHVGITLRGRMFAIILCAGEKRVPYPKETVEASRIAAIKVVTVLAELVDNTSFMGTSASAVQMFMLYHRALFT